MDHKFKHRWRSYVFRNNAWQFEGYMDLSTMAENGHIEDVQHPGTPTILFRGDAIANTALRLKSVLGITYVGFLTHDMPDHMTITGVEHFGFADADAQARFVEATRGVGALDQDDPPWVITKP